MKPLELINEWQEKVRQYWITLNPREKILLSSVAGVMCLLLVLAVGKQIFGAVFERAAQAEQVQANIGTIDRLSKKLRKQQGSLLSYERLRRLRGDNFDLIAEIRKNAPLYGADIKKLAPTRAKKATEEDAEWIELELGGSTTLSAAVKLLESIERPLGVRIVELSMKPQFSNKSQFEVTALIMNLKEL